MSDGYRLRVVTGDELRSWRPEEGTYDDYYGAIKARIEEIGETIIWFHGNNFTWICPGCGGTNMGTLGEEVVSGWVNPRWVRSGDDEHLSLAPSLGCPTWRNGACIGHWWARDGRLVLA